VEKWVEDGERCYKLHSGDKAVACVTNLDGWVTDRHWSGKAQDKKPGNREKGGDVFVVVVESTDTEDEKQGGRWDGQGKKLVYVNADSAVVNGSG